jgi:NADPH-dependent glutamate synthase beta subunit-like oxidoreductase/ferredoxin
MTRKRVLTEEIPLFFPRSSTSTENNKTGSWRYMRPLYAEKTAPCSAACALGEDIPRIEMLAAQGMLKEAWQTILDENPFPSVCGRVCFHPCESACNRGQLDEPIAIHHLERFLGDAAMTDGRAFDPKKAAAKGKKVAVVGAGPAGLATAYFLSRLGYACNVFEARPEPGGILRWGIPAYRLPEDMLKKEIRRIESQGINIQCDRTVTSKFLQKIGERYDALFIGCGSGRSIKLNIPGGKMAHDGLQLLDNVRAGKLSSLQGTAAVLGGGNTAVDVARTLLRLGAAPVIVYRRRKQDMPAFGPEIEMALQEGIDLRELWTPVGIEVSRSASSACRESYFLTLQKMKASIKETSGRARVVPDGNKTERLHVRHIFCAIGAEPRQFWELPWWPTSRQLALSHCTLIKKDLPVVYGGDLINATKSVSDAVASGKQAAMALDCYFQKGWDPISKILEGCRVGSGPALSMTKYLNREHRERNSHIVSFGEINADYFLAARRSTPPTLAPDQRIRSFAEIQSTFSRKAAVAEAGRCFNCGSCNACDYCRLFCPEMAVIVEETRRHIDLDYCKGCGICVTECPRNAMAMEEENE